MIDVETIFDSDREEYEFMQENKEKPMKEQIEEMRNFMLEKSNSANVEPVFTTNDGKEIVLGKELTKLLNDVLEQAFIPFLAEALYNAGYRKQSEDVTDINVGNKSEWISVDERLPEENGRYLVLVDISHFAFENLTTIAIMGYGKSHGFYLYNDTEKVTHWMPLPEPPKMKGGAEE